VEVMRRSFCQGWNQAAFLVVVVVVVVRCSSGRDHVGPVGVLMVMVVSAAVGGVMQGR
jgi:hypothetical protein